MQSKNIGYAYASSDIAVATGHAATGCYYLAVYDDSKPMDVDDIVFSSLDKDMVKDQAELLALPFGAYSMDVPTPQADPNNFDDAYRYTDPVKSTLIESLPITPYRPEAMRVSMRESDRDTWFEVEIFNPTLGRWIDQKAQEDRNTALADARGWYPSPEMREQQALSEEDPEIEDDSMSCGM